jgi:hypothetical protein
MELRLNNLQYYNPWLTCGIVCLQELQCNSTLEINFASLKLNTRTTFEARLHVLYPTFYLQKLEL